MKLKLIQGVDIPAALLTESVNTLPESNIWEIEVDTDKLSDEHKEYLAANTVFLELNGTKGYSVLWGASNDRRVIGVSSPESEQLLKAIDTIIVFDSNSEENNPDSI